MINSVIEAHGGIYMSTIDIPGAYLYTDSDEEVIMIPKGRLVGILVNIYLTLYRKYVVLEKEVKVLYVKLQKALYGLLRSSIFFSVISNRLEK